MFPAKLSVFSASVGLSIISATIILSFRQFFFYVPFGSGFSFRETFAFLAQIGWISLLFLPPLILRGAERWTNLRMWLLIASSSIYTLATVAIKGNNLALFGDPFALYLATYPALLFLEWGLPAFYLAVAIMLRRKGYAGPASARRGRPEYREAPEVVPNSFDQ